MLSKEELDIAYGAPIDTTPCTKPDTTVELKGNYVTLKYWKSEYTPSLWTYYKVDPMLVAYMPMPQDLVDEEALRKELDPLAGHEDIVTYGIFANAKRLNPELDGPSSIPDAERTDCIGIAFLGHISVDDRAIEVGALWTPVLHRTAAGSEVHYLLLKHVLDAGSPLLGPGSPPYRRVAWKCNHLNQKSRDSAMRVGYVFEGTERQLKITNGRTRDEDTFSLLDREWPVAKAALEKWLGAGNWTAQGQQIKKLQAIRAELAESA